jgi:hypothetical protein
MKKLVATHNAADNGVHTSHEERISGLERLIFPDAKYRAGKPD